MKIASFDILPVQGCGRVLDPNSLRRQLALLTREDGGFRPAAQLVPDAGAAVDLRDVADRLTDALPVLAGEQARVASRLYLIGDLHLPTSQIPDADVPRPYAPLPADRFDAITNAYAAARIATRAMATRGTPDRLADREASPGRLLDLSRSIRGRPRAAQRIPDPTPLRALSR